MSLSGHSTRLDSRLTSLGVACCRRVLALGLAVSRGGRSTRESDSKDCEQRTPTARGDFSSVPIGDLARGYLGVRRCSQIGGPVALRSGRAIVPHHPRLPDVRRHLDREGFFDRSIELQSRSFLRYSWRVVTELGTRLPDVLIHQPVPEVGTRPVDPQ